MVRFGTSAEGRLPCNVTGKGLKALVSSVRAAGGLREDLEAGKLLKELVGIAF